MNEIIGIIPHKFRRRGFGVACTLLLRAGLNFLGLAVLLPVLALALDARSLDGGGQLARDQGHVAHVELDLAGGDIEFERAVALPCEFAAVRAGVRAALHGR